MVQKLELEKKFRASAKILAHEIKFEAESTIFIAAALPKAVKAAEIARVMCRAG